LEGIGGRSHNGLILAESMICPPFFMTEFTLDARLRNDTHQLGSLNGQLLLLMNNALAPWFILVPLTDHSEIYLLDTEERATLDRNIDLLSRHLLAHFAVEKINIGAIGNIVKQLHIHVIGRSRNDYAWPGVVWGNPARQDYTAEQLQSIAAGLCADPYMPGFTPANPSGGID